ncbi:hypothetical protein MEW_02340 [Candida albicans P60002]|nr:hypothetical protein MG1_02415 [Candida albicans GC75]KHC54066.1 hypothetical protein MEW_02340 [Candida albicans P60002]
MRSPNDDNNKCVCVCVKLISIYLSIPPFLNPKMDTTTHYNKR